MLNRLIGFARTEARPPHNDVKAVASPQNATALETHRVDELVTSMTGLFRKASNYLSFAMGSGGAADGDQKAEEENQVLFCKNNVCVHGPALGSCESNGSTPRSPEEEHHPGYLSVRSQRDSVLGKTLILTWIPNKTIEKNPGSFQTTPDKSPSSARSDPPQPSISSSVSGDAVIVTSESPSASATASELGFAIVDSPFERGAGVDRKTQLSLDLIASLQQSQDSQDSQLPSAGSSSSPPTSGPDSPNDDDSPSVANQTNEDSKLQSPSISQRTSEAVRDPVCGVFSVDLGLMRSVRFFYAETGPGRSGQMVVASPESQYKVLHFHNGGMEKLEAALQDWRFFSRQKSKKHEAAEKFYRQYTVVRPNYVASQRHPEEGQHSMVSTELWRSFVNSTGQIEDVALLRKAIFFGGLHPSVRGEAWPYLLKYYAFDSTWEEREQHRNDCFLAYQELRARRANMDEETASDFYQRVECIVEKDVVRTDRRNSFYAGEDNDNVQLLKEILLNYAVAHPQTGYMQGMSDLLAPILAEVRKEIDAYWCFEGLMQKTIFVSSPKDTDMDRQLGYLRDLIRIMAPDFHKHLVKLGGHAEDLLFCHRWILLCFKREFGEQDALRIWEACWAHYQTDYFHLFVCLAIIQLYGESAVHEKLSADDMLLYFTSLSLHMDVKLVLVQARSMLHKFRARQTVPCSLSGLCLLCGPGIWDSGHAPAVDCTGHPDNAPCPHVANASSPF